MAGTVIGKVKDYRIDKNLTGTKNVVLLTVQLFDNDDLQTVELMTQAGDNSIPQKDSLVYVMQAARNYKIGIAVGDGITPDTTDGEKKLYSQDQGIIKAFITWLKDGILHINGSNDFAVRFNELKTGFDQLKNDFNTFVTTVYNSHVHGTTPGPSPTGQASSANIDASKVDNVKVSGFTD